MMKIATFFVILCAIFGLLCIAHAAPKQKRDLLNMKDLIREIKAESNSARIQDNEEEEAIAQPFLKLLEKEAKAEHYKDSNKLAQTDSFADKIRYFFHRLKNGAKKRYNNFISKLSKFFHIKG